MADSISVPPDQWQRGSTSVTLPPSGTETQALAFASALLGQPYPETAAGSQFATAGLPCGRRLLPNGSGRTDLSSTRAIGHHQPEAVVQGAGLFLNAAPTPVAVWWFPPLGVSPTARLVPPTPVPAPTATPTASRLRAGGARRRRRATHRGQTADARSDPRPLAAPAAAAPPAAGPGRQQHRGGRAHGSGTPERGLRRPVRAPWWRHPDRVRAGARNARRAGRSG